MKRILIILSILILGGLIDQKSFAAPNPPQVGVEFGFFYSSLSPHGEWIDMESGVRVWRPMRMDDQWRPYLTGRWIWTDYGWYWASNEPFGWITYHYGRWYYDDYYGWVWMPDDVWGPAWVEWRYDNDYIGWAPLPPYARFHMSFGIRFSTHWAAPAHYWNFVHYNHFGGDIYRGNVAPIEQSRRLIRTTRSRSQYRVDNGHVINRGVERTTIEKRGNIKISRTEVRDTREQSGERIVRSGNNQRMDRIEVYRPSRDEMQRSSGNVEARRGERNLSIDMDKVDRSRVDSRTSSRNSSVDRQAQIEKRQSNQGIQRGTQQQVQKREGTPQVQEQIQQQDRKEMRRELIQRHENKQNTSPPVSREIRQQRTEQRRESSSRSSSNSSDKERSSSRSSRRSR